MNGWGFNRENKQQAGTRRTHSQVDLGSVKRMLRREEAEQLVLTYDNLTHGDEMRRAQIEASDDLGLMRQETDKGYIETIGWTCDTTLKNMEGTHIEEFDYSAGGEYADD